MATLSSSPSAPAITQNPDIRYLGRLLGDVIRAYGGDSLYRQTEYIRSASVDRARGIQGADLVDTGLDALSLDDTLNFTRGFMLFSMLANLAEDRQGVAADPGADVASAIARLDSHGIDRDAVLGLLAHSLIVKDGKPAHTVTAIPTGHAVAAGLVWQTRHSTLDNSPLLNSSFTRVVVHTHRRPHPLHQHTVPPPTNRSSTVSAARLAAPAARR